MGDLKRITSDSLLLDPSILNKAALLTNMSYFVIAISCQISSYAFHADVVHQGCVTHFLILESF